MVAIPLVLGDFKSLRFEIAAIPICDLKPFAKIGVGRRRGQAVSCQIPGNPAEIWKKVHSKSLEKSSVSDGAECAPHRA